MHPSEIMTILIHFHQARYRDFKTYYTQFVAPFLRREFPHLVSYSRFVQLIPAFVVPLSAYLYHCFGRCSGINFIDLTALAVCDTRRIHQHQVFAETAARGKTSLGCSMASSCTRLSTSVSSYSLVASRREMLMTARQPVSDLAERIFGKLFGDKGYLSQPWFERLWAQGV